MNFFKVFAALTVASQQVQQALSDKELTVDEIYKIVDSAIKELAGVGFDGIGIKLEKDEKGRTKVTFFIDNKK